MENATREERISLSKLEIVERKGIGEKHEDHNFCGSSYKKYVHLITDGDPIIPRFNVQIVDNPLDTEPFLRYIKLSEVYLFPQLVSEERARTAYDLIK